MKKLMLTLLCLVWVGTASAFQPRTGHWWNPVESGRGFNIDIQDNVLVVAMYAYQSGGAAQWYLASGGMTNSGHNFTGTLDKYQGGQCASCGFAGSPSLVGNDGVISISFTSEVAATVTLPGGRTTTIQPYNFGFGDAPQGLLGEWIFVYDIIAGGNTYAERFNFTTIATGTADGNGMVVDVGRRAACELTVRGSLAGTVLCVDQGSDGNVQNQYMFRFGLDETYDGYWVSPTTFKQYSMKGLKTKSKSGISRSATVDDRVSIMSAGVIPEGGENLSTKLTAERNVRALAIDSPDGELRRAFEEVRQVMRATY